MKKFVKPLLYSIILLFVLTLIITLFNYIGLIRGTVLKIIKLIIPVISFGIGGFMIGRNSNKKGWLNGIQVGLILSFIFVIINLLFKNKINILFILYYLVLILFSTIGSILGINRKK